VSLIDGPTVLAAGVTLALSLGVSRRLGMGWPAGPAYGFLALVASSNLALFALRASGGPVRLLPVLGVVGAIVLVEIVRRARPPQPEPRLDAPPLPTAGSAVYWGLVALIALQIYLMRTIYPGPAAGITPSITFEPMTRSKASSRAIAWRTNAKSQKSTFTMTTISRLAVAMPCFRARP
jgi:hypothetical protein